MNRRQVLKAMAAASALGVAAPALIGTGRAQSKVTLKFGHLANEQNVWHKAALKFAEEVKTLTEGRIECAVFPNESLGNELDVIKGMQLGAADMVITGESLQNWAPSASLLAIPYGVTSLEQMDRIASGAIGKQINDEILAKALVRPIAYLARGPRDLTANRAITKPDDLKGLRLRVPNVPLFVAVWTALGGRPTPMAFGEVFTSLQNGTIDGQENPLALIKSANFNEVQKFLNKTEHVRSWIYIAISEQRFQSFSAKDKENVLEAARRAQKFERPLFLTDEKALEAELKQKGMTFVDSDQKAFADKSRDAVLKGVKPEVRPLLEKMMAA
jgi:TRAP-type transport system periplasmic protein